MNYGPNGEPPGPPGPGPYGRHQAGAINATGAHGGQAQDHTGGFKQGLYGQRGAQGGGQAQHHTEGAEEEQQQQEQEQGRRRRRKEQKGKTKNHSQRFGN